MVTREKRPGRGPGTPVPNLKKERVLQGYTVRGLAEAAGIDASTVNAAENGHRGVQGTTLTKLARTLGVNARSLVGDALGESEAPRRRLGLSGEDRVRLSPGESIEELVSAGRGE